MLLKYCKLRIFLQLSSEIYWSCRIKLELKVKASQYLQVESNVDFAGVFEFGLFRSSEDEDGSSDPGEEVRADAQLLGRAVAREISQRLIVP